MYHTALSETDTTSFILTNLRMAAWVSSYMNEIVNRTHGVTISLWKLTEIRTFILTKREIASISMRNF